MPRRGLLSLPQGHGEEWAGVYRPRGRELVRDDRHSSAVEASRVAELTGEGVIGIGIIKGQVMVTLPEADLVLTKLSFQRALRVCAPPPAPRAAGRRGQRVWPGTGPLPCAPPAGLG
jgi:hypothetical protein